MKEASCRGYFGIQHHGKGQHGAVFATFARSELTVAAQAAKDFPLRPRPNILWITAEDMSPTLGCYGDDYATTPNLDRFRQGLR